MECQFCGHKIEGASKTCPACQRPLGGNIDGGAALREGGAGESWKYRFALLSMALVFAGLILLWVLFRPQHMVHLMVNHHDSWDRLAITAALLEGKGGQPLPATLQRVTVKDSSGKLLYEGDSSTPAIADGQLADAEKLTVEACLTSPATSDPVCATTELLASPKRVVLEGASQLRWPVSSVDYRLGELSGSFWRERTLFGDRDRWERLDPVNGRVDLELQLLGGNETVLLRDLMLDGTKRSFSLEDGEGFAAFSSGMEKRLAQGESARVQAKLLQKGSAKTVALDVGERVFRRKTLAERETEVLRCVQEIAGLIVANEYGGGQSIKGSVRGNWRYDESRGRYFVDMDVRWLGLMTAIPYSIALAVEFGDEGQGTYFRRSSEDAAVALMKLMGGMANNAEGGLGNVSCQ